MKKKKCPMEHSIKRIDRMIRRIEKYQEAVREKERSKLEPKPDPVFKV